MGTRIRSEGDEIEEKNKNAQKRLKLNPGRGR